MKALVLRIVGQSPVLEERESLQAKPGEVVVRLRAAALNRRDYWITQGQYPGTKTPVVLGSDGAGVVSDLGTDVDEGWRERDVIIDPGFDWGHDRAAQSSAFTILGLPRDGTFASEVAVPARQLHVKPSSLNWNEAAALPLAGVTAYRAVFTQGCLRKGETVLVTGVGGGVATFALQFAVAEGARVWVTSSSEDKIKQAMHRGAEGGFNYKETGWTKKFVEKAGAPHLIIDSAGGAGYASLIDLAAPGGRLVNYGATAGPPEKIDLFKVFWKQLHLQGSTMGSPEDFAEMLAFVEKHAIKPVIDAAFPLERGDEALRLMKDSPQFGKYVLEIG